MASKRKNSLVENINRRKRAGKSRPKSRSTVSKESYDRMEQGWPKAGKKKAARKKTTARTTSASPRKSSGAKTKTSKKRASKKK